MATNTYKIKYGDTLTAIAKANGTTVDAILKNNPNIKNPNQIFAGTSLSIVPTATAPVTPPTPTTPPTNTPPVTTPPATTGTGTPTTDPSYKKPISSLVPEYNFSDSDPVVKNYMEEIKKTAGDTIDETEVRRQARERVQAQIDSLKIAGEQALARAKVAGANRLGSTYSTQARSGTLGSNFASSENNQVSEYNRGIETDIEAETQAKIIGLLNQADKDASADITARKEAKSKSADEYVKYLTTRDTDRKSKATTLAKAFALQKVDPTTLSDEDKKRLADSYGMDLTTFNALVTEQKNALQKEQDALEKDRFKTISDGSYLYDTKTGEIIENTKNFAPGSSSSTPYSTGQKVVDVEDAMQRIANIETKDRANPYQVRSDKPTTRTRADGSTYQDWAYGKYQVMGDNIPSWTKEVTGKSMTIQEFLNSPETQDAVARQKLSEYKAKHGTWEDAASVWFSGKPLAGNTAKDVFGTSTPDYVKKFSGVVEYGDPDFTLNLIRNSAGNKRVPTEGELNPIIKAQRALTQLSSISTNISQSDTGPIIGLLRSYNPYDSNAQSVKAQLQALIPTLARGVYGEVGVLTDQDIENYRKTIPNLQSTDDVNKLVLAMTIDGIKGSIESQLMNLAAGNRNVANYEPIYVGLKNQAQSLRDSISGGGDKIASTTTGDTVRMRGPNGQTGQVARSKVDSATAQGWVVIN